MTAPSAPLLKLAPQDSDLERRFGGLRRLYGPHNYERLRAARVAVVGLGGVGSWAAEALARSGVAALVLIDFDHVAESNVNRQVQALGSTLGRAKALALQDRIADIHPACQVTVVDAFVEPDNWPALLPQPVDVLVDACDQVRAKLTLAMWSASSGVPVVCVGAAGGKQQPQQVEVGDLAQVTHDPLLAGLRQRLRKARRAAAVPPPTGAGGRKKSQALAGSAADALGLCCVFSREAVSLPDNACEAPGSLAHDGGLNCQGYGSSVTVTATFGMVAAAQAIRLVISPKRDREA